MVPDPSLPSADRVRLPDRPSIRNTCFKIYPQDHNPSPSRAKFEAGVAAAGLV